MSESAGSTGPGRAPARVAHEAYSFACMRCGHGWEQSFAIEHHTDAGGREFVRYVADGRVVPSPLSRPTCGRCGNHLVRIMGPGRVASAREAARPGPAAGRAAVPRPRAAAEAGRTGKAGEKHHWHLSDLLNALHLHRGAS
ncbi:hypothetical protein SUDANB58_02324 [Streptomyces sp. enrichment culture]|uniref:hypothetical protein n=1 Tax=Streptomyces sp. enrichment culture TaxID=1795815 RepID=UPI003F57F72B